MGTTHATNTSGAVFSDLFGADETVLNTALEQLGDNDLLFAVLVINTRPVNHGTGERTTARRLADIFAHAKTSGGASQIAHELFRNIRPGLIVECLCERTGVSEEDIDKAKRAVGVDLIKFYTDHIAALPFGQVFISAALSAEMLRSRVARHAESSDSLVRGFLRLADDINVVKEAAWFTKHEIAVPAMDRLVELGATEVLDELVQDRGTLGLRIQRHDDARRMIAHASKATQLNLANESNLGFVYRQAAASQLHDTDLLRIAESTVHENVRNSANRELALRGVISISESELQRL